jgi:dipeptidyl aminopeptidase/acylaminoacyl peptidase
MPRIPALALTATAVLLAAAPAAHAATNGPLAFAADDGLFVQPLQGSELTRVDRGGVQTVAASRDGKLLAFGTSVGDDVRLSVAATAGGPTRTVRLKGISINSIDISPDKRLLAITAFRDNDSTPGHIFAYLVRRDGTKLRALRTKARFAVDMRFTPDGKSLLYVSPSSTPEEISDCTSSIRRIRLDGTRDTALYKGTGGTLACPLSLSLSPTGTSVAMAALESGDEPAGPGPAPNVYRLSLTTKGAKPKLLVRQGYAPAWSPGGDQIAYTSTRSPFGPATDPTGTFRIPAAGGTPVRVSERSASAIAWLRGPG